METALTPAMTLLYLMAARLCLKQLDQLQFSNDDWIVLTAVLLISIALGISHRVHMISGR